MMKRDDSLVKRTVLKSLETPQSGRSSRETYGRRTLCSWLSMGQDKAFEVRRPVAESAATSHKVLLRHAPARRLWDRQGLWEYGI